MTQFLTLLRFTEKGLQDVQNSGRRATEFRATVESAGGKVISQHWAIGAWDGCVMFEAPNEQAAASLLLALDRLGNVRTRTLRLFDESEFASIANMV